jgi:uncharacterized membrane protein
MQSPTEPASSADLTPELFGFCLLLASSLQIMEHLLPKVPIFPWLRLGLAYLIILPFLLRFGVRNTVMLFISRNLITLVYGGQVFSAFLISTLSGVISIGVAGCLGVFLYHSGVLGLVGTSVMLACSFNLTQLIVVNFLFVRHGDFFFQLPPMLLWSLISGSLIALVVYKSAGDLELLFSRSRKARAVDPGREGDGASPATIFRLSTAGALLFGLLWIPSIQFQLALLPLLLGISRLRGMKVLYYAWPFYFYLAWLHLFRTDGIYVFRDWITREGLDSFIYYSLRTTNIILCGQWLSRYITGIWKHTMGNFYLNGVGYALPLLPALFGLSLALGRDFFRQMRHRNFDHPLYTLIQKIEAEIGKFTTGSTG